MPYIKREDRDEVIIHGPTTVGELNYMITQLCLEYLENLPTEGPDYKDYHYADYNGVIGALECAKIEFYRRAVAPYEDKKILENGDVY